MEGEQQALLKKFLRHGVAQYVLPEAGYYIRLSLRKCRRRSGRGGGSSEDGYGKIMTGGNKPDVGAQKVLNCR